MYSQVSICIDPRALHGKSQVRIFGGNCQWTYRDWSASYYWKMYMENPKLFQVSPGFYLQQRSMFQMLWILGPKMVKKTMI